MKTKELMLRTPARRTRITKTKDDFIDLYTLDYRIESRLFQLIKDKKLSEIEKYQGDFNEPSKTGSLPCTPLGYALLICQNQTALIQCLIRKGARLTKEELILQFGLTCLLDQPYLIDIFLQWDPGVINQRYQLLLRPDIFKKGIYFLSKMQDGVPQITIFHPGVTKENESSTTQVSALYLAVYPSREKTIEILLNNNVDISTFNGPSADENMSPLMFASRQGNLKIVTQLLDGQDKALKEHKELQEKTQVDRDYALFHASLARHTAVATLLVKRGAVIKDYDANLECLRRIKEIEKKEKEETRKEKSKKKKKAEKINDQERSRLKTELTSFFEGFKNVGDNEKQCQTALFSQGCFKKDFLKQFQTVTLKMTDYLVVFNETTLELEQGKRVHLFEIQRRIYKLSKEYAQHQETQKANKKHADIMLSQKEQVQRTYVDLMSLYGQFQERMIRIERHAEDLPNILVKGISLIHDWNEKASAIKNPEKIQAKNFLKHMIPKLMEMNEGIIGKIKTHQESIRDLKRENDSISHEFSSHYETDYAGVKECVLQYDDTILQIKSTESKENDEDRKLEAEALNSLKDEIASAINSIAKRMVDCQVRQKILFGKLQDISNYCIDQEARIADLNETLFSSETPLATILPETETITAVLQTDKTADDIKQSEEEKEKRELRHQKFLENKRRVAETKANEAKQMAEKRTRLYEEQQRNRAQHPNATRTEHSSVPRRTKNMVIVLKLIQAKYALHVSSSKVLSGIIINEFDADELFLERDGILVACANLMELIHQGKGALSFSRERASHFRDAVWHSIALFNGTATKRGIGTGRNSELRTMMSQILELTQNNGQGQRTRDVSSLITSEIFQEIVDFGEGSRTEQSNFNYQACITEMESLNRRYERLAFSREELAPYKAIVSDLIFGRISSFHKHAKRCLQYAQYSEEDRASMTQALSVFQPFLQEGTDRRHVQSNEQTRTALLLSRGAKMVSSARTESPHDENKGQETEQPLDIQCKQTPAVGAGS